MQRETRMKREVINLAQEPPPGVSCWLKGENVDKLEAGKLTVITFFFPLTDSGGNA